jgi:hypothetical protein
MLGQVTSRCRLIDDRRRNVFRKQPRTPSIQLKLIESQTECASEDIGETPSVIILVICRGNSSGAHPLLVPVLSRAAANQQARPLHPA